MTLSLPRLSSASRPALWAVLALACAAGTACAQGRGGPPGGMGGGGMGRPSMGGEVRGMSLPNANERSQGSFHLGPPGRWWDNKAFAKSIGLAPQQQHRMDDVYNANRDTLLTLYKSLQHEESQLDKLTRSKELDENQIFQQIDRVTAARGESEKAYAHMMLQIRKELTPEQTAKLDVLPPPQDQ